MNAITYQPGTIVHLTFLHLFIISIINEEKNKYKLENSFTTANLAGLSSYPVTGYFASKIAINISKIFTDDVIIIFYFGRIINIVKGF